MSQLPLYEEFKVANFRGFDLLEIDGLRRINVVVGRNNTGKTSLLEAMAIPIEVGSEWPGDILRIQKEPASTKRLVKPISSADQTSLFYWNAGASGLGIAVNENAGKVFRQTPRKIDAYLRWIGGANLSGVYGSMNASERFGEGVVRAGGQVLSGFLRAEGELSRFDQAMLDTQFEPRIEAILRSLDDRVRSVRALALAGSEREIYVDIGLPQRVPLSLLGQGMQRLMSLATHAYAARGGMLFIDEIEIGLHHSYLEELWAGIRRMAGVLDLQVVATTHSYECLAAASVSASAVEDLAVIRLERGSDNRISAQTLSGERLLNAIAHGAELR